jgi:hypothetical protein
MNRRAYWYLPGWILTHCKIPYESFTCCGFSNYDAGSSFSKLVGLDGFECDESYDSRAIEELVDHALLFRQG